MKKKPEEQGGHPPPDEAAVRARALDLLARREHSRLELDRKLRLRDFPPELINPVLDSLSAEGLLSESRFAEEWVRSRVARGQGPNKIWAELRQRGLDEAEVRQALARCDTDWSRQAFEVRRKWFGAEVPTALAERARQTRFLVSRGFTTEQIRQAMGQDGD